VLPSGPESGAAAAPLTLGTAGHIDHGKTVLVRALTGVDTDRLPQERERGISIELGFAPLALPSGRRLSVIDAPGHERFVRTMVAGATGIDMFLLVVAADDGVMPQTREHSRVLQALGVTAGVVALTKADTVAEERLAEVRAAVQGLVAATSDDAPEAIAVSALDGTGIAELLVALDRTAAGLPGRAAAEGPLRLHVDRSFTMRGAGTVVTGTLWAGRLSAGERVRIEPGGAEHRIRGLQVHGSPVDHASAGQRVAVNLAGADRRSIRRGDVLTEPGSEVRSRHRFDARLVLAPGSPPLERGTRVQVHHGTREAPARVVPHGDGSAGPGRPAAVQLRLEQPLLAVTGDRFVVRRIAPPDTLGGGVVIAPAPAVPAEEPDSQTARTPVMTAADQALVAEVERLLAAAGHTPPRLADLARAAGSSARAVEGALAGRAVRAGRDLWFAAAALTRARVAVEELCGRDGAVTIATLRDRLGTSRMYAQAMLERFDGERLLVRVGDEHRLRASRGSNR
jgi:selenocysteine-specific elongation factor